MPDPRQFALFYIPHSSVKQRSLVALAFHGLQARAMSIDCLITSCLQGPEVIKQVTWDGCSYTQPDLPPVPGCPSTYGSRERLSDENELNFQAL